MFRKFTVCVAVIISFCLFNNVSAQIYGPPIPLYLNYQGKLLVLPFAPSVLPLFPSVYFVNIFPLALRIPACGADVAAFLVDEHVAALGALSRQVLGQAVVLHLGLIITADMLLQDAGDGVSAGEDGLALLPGY